MDIYKNLPVKGAPAAQLPLIGNIFMYRIPERGRICRSAASFPLITLFIYLLKQRHPDLYVLDTLIFYLQKKSLSQFLNLSPLGARARGSGGVGMVPKNPKNYPDHVPVIRGLKIHTKSPLKPYEY